MIGGRLLWLALLLPVSLPAGAQVQDGMVEDPSYPGVSYGVEADLVERWQTQVSYELLLADTRPASH